MRLARVLIALVAGSAAAAGCGDAGGDGEVRVFAAASLTDAFTELASAFEATHAGTDVVVSFGSSSSLREQVLAGAPADVFASADASHVDALVDAGAAVDPRVFATNELQIAVPAGNPAGITGLADFADEGRFIGLCAPGVPCGDLARRALASAGVTPAPDTEAPDVRALLTQIESGDLDAGIVYRTDVLAAGDAVEGLDLPAEHRVVARYPIARLADASDVSGADAFVAFVLSEEGQTVLARYGFGPA